MKTSRSTLVSIGLIATCLLASPTALLAGKKEEKAAELAALAEPRLMHTLQVPAGLSADTVGQLISKSLKTRNWMVMQEGEGKVLASYSRQPVTVALTINYTDTTVEIWSKGTGDLEKLKKKEAQWLANVVKDVTDAMAAAAPAPAS